MNALSRRDFLGHSAAAVGTMAVTNMLAGAEEAPRVLKSAADEVTLGRSGIKTSLLGIGTGSVGVRRTSHQVQLGQVKFTQLIRHAYDQGIRYIDTADQYGSHIFVREAIKGLPRDKLFIQTKTRAHSGGGPCRYRTLPRGARPRYARYLTHALHDNWFLAHGHASGDGRASRSQGKEKGARSVGVSCHGMAPLQAAAKCDWIDVDLARINPVGGNPGRMDGTPEQVAACLKTMHAADKGIIGMKILAEGTLKTAEEQMKSLRFVLGLGCVDCFVIGFESPEQIDQVVKRIEQVLRA